MKEPLDPLYEDFWKWKRGELSHDELCERIHEFPKEKQNEARNLGHTER
jgi:hypothetical protein